MNEANLKNPMLNMEPAPIAYHLGGMVPFEQAVLPIDCEAALGAYTVFGLMVASRC